MFCFHSKKQKRMPLLQVDGDILHDDYTVIGHLADCVSSHPRGFSSVLFQTYPHADCYSSRNGTRDTPGTIIGKGDGKTERYVVHLLAQYYPGPSKWDRDSPEKRQQWFSQCLWQLYQCTIFHYQETKLAFPYGMGGGDQWPIYQTLLERLAAHLPCQIFIVRWNGATA
jgi:hypothetical protein